jgi:hypothetical protein
MQSENKVVAFFLEELQAAHQTLEGTIIGVTKVGTSGSFGYGPKSAVGGSEKFGLTF